MIPRYARAPMTAIWEETEKFNIWLEIERHALDAMVRLGQAPKSAALALHKKGKVTPARIAKLEETTRHDVLAFLTNLAENVGPQARFIHQGMTSSDVLDTCLNVQLTRASDILLADLRALLRVLKRRAQRYKHTLCMGRSHGIHAEPTSFGLKLAYAYAEFARHYERLLRARAEIASCAISGPVGNYASIDPYVEAYVARKMKLAVEPISTQVIPRDRHAMFFATLGVIASSIERLAVEIRHLQRSEVGEVEEFFAKDQKGSSAMPHKRNPIHAENLTGLARLVRASVIPALENVALWHERDISHSSVERVIAPDTTIILGFALHRLSLLMDKLVVYPKRMAHNISQTKGLAYSHRILLALTQAGVAREDAYRWVQACAHQAQSDLGGGDFFTRLCADKNIAKHITPEALQTFFDPKTYLIHTNTIFRRVFGASSKA